MTTRLYMPPVALPVLLALSVAGLPRGQDDASHAPSAETTVSLPETMKLSRLVDVAGEVSGQAYSYNPSELDTVVTLRIPGGLRAAAVGMGA